MGFISQDQKLSVTNYNKANTYNYKNLKISITIITE